MSTPFTIVGTIGTVPERRETTNKIVVCRFRLACSERRFDREKDLWIDGDPNWFTIIAYRGLAEHSHGSFNKGDRIIVSGRLRVRPWHNDDGKSGVAVEVEADSLGHDLRWGTTKFTRAPSLQASEHDRVDAASSEQEGFETAERAEAEQPSHTLARAGELVGVGSTEAPF
jgi:single-strand DNA-binding protein